MHIFLMKALGAPFGVFWGSPQAKVFSFFLNWTQVFSIKWSEKIDLSHSSICIFWTKYYRHLRITRGFMGVNAAVHRLLTELFASADNISFKKYILKSVKEGQWCNTRFIRKNADIISFKKYILESEKTVWYSNGKLYMSQAKKTHRFSGSNMYFWTK